VDVTISDLVADLRAPTPSAAAEAVAPDKEEILRYLRVASTRLAQGLKRGVVGQGRAFAQARAGLWRLARGLVTPRRERLARTEEALIRHVETLTQRRKASLAQLAGKMDALSPLSTLQRGYAVPLDGGGRVLRGVKEFSPGDEFLLRVVDGKVRCETVETIKEEVSGE
jgi:exodeoxyribonuclease VII large subunit